MMRRQRQLRIVASALLLLLSVGMKAQMDVQFADYTRLRSYYNPAVSGVDGTLNVVGAYAMQFVGYDNAPATMYVGADLPIYFLGPRHGAGINLMSDKAGIFTTQKVGLQYAFNAALGKRTRLAVGAQAAFLSEKISPGNLKLEEQNDPAFPSAEVNGSKFDFAAGIYFYHPNYWAGVAAQHLTAPLVELGERNEFQFERLYNLMGGCNIRIKNSFLSLQPSFMVLTDFRSWREDVQCRLAYEYESRAFYVGVGYSPDVSTTFLLGGNFHGISLGYSYQMFTSGIGLVNGSHEITLAYQVDLDLFKKGRNRHKSVRFL